MDFVSADQESATQQRAKPRQSVLEVRDRERPHGKPIFWLLLEREAITSLDPSDGAVHAASICIVCQIIEPGRTQRASVKTKFWGGYSRGALDTPKVSLTSPSLGEGAIFLNQPELLGHRVGTYLMNEIVSWAQQWPQASVNQIKLEAGQAQEDNKARRNRFYEQFGLKFNYLDETHRAGISRPMQVKNLNTVRTWQDNLRVHDVRELVGELLDELNRAREQLAQSHEGRTSINQELEHAQAHPVRWTLKQWWRRLR